MALKQCEYCRTFSDSKNTHCPACSAPLNNKIIPEDGNIKETVSVAVTGAINKATSSINKAMNPSSPYEYDYPAAKPTQQTPTHTDDGRRYLNKWIVLVLALVGGLWGIHRFYEGKIFTGILYIFTLGFFWIGIIIDICLILSRPTRYPAKR